MLLGVDVGGTFTDAVLVVDGVVHTAKAPTTPDDQSRGRHGRRRARAERRGRAGGRRRGLRPRHDGRDQRAARGHRRAHGLRAPPRASPTSSPSAARPARELYRLCAAHPAPLTPPERRFAARERTGPDGVLEPLADLTRLVDAVAGAEPEAIAVCLLHSYRHPEPRARDRRRAARAPRRPRVAVARGGRHVPRVRARGDHRGRRRALPAARALPAPPAGRPRDAGLPQPGDHAVQRRPGRGSRWPPITPR